MQVTLEVRAIAEQNIRLLYACQKIIPKHLQDRITWQEFGAEYISAVMDWVDDGKPGTLSTYVFHAVEWAIPKIANSHVIKTPTFGEAKRMVSKSKILKAKRTKFLHGKEGINEDPAMTYEPNLAKNIEDEERQRAISESMKFLRPTEQKVVSFRFGLECEKHTLESIGNLMGKSKERVRQILIRATRKLSSRTNLAAV